MNNLINNFNNNVRGRRSNSNGDNDNNGSFSAPFTQVNNVENNLTNDTIILDDSQPRQYQSNNYENDLIVSMNMFNSQGQLEQNVFDEVENEENGQNLCRRHRSHQICNGT